MCRTWLRRLVEEVVAIGEEPEEVRSELASLPRPAEWSAVLAHRVRVLAIARRALPGAVAAVKALVAADLPRAREHLLSALDELEAGVTVPRGFAE